MFTGFRRVATQGVKLGSFARPSFSSSALKPGKDICGDIFLGMKLVIAYVFMIMNMNRV